MGDQYGASLQVGLAALQQQQSERASEQARERARATRIIRRPTFRCPQVAASRKRKQQQHSAGWHAHSNSSAQGTSADCAVSASVEEREVQSQAAERRVSPGGQGCCIAVAVALLVLAIAVTASFARTAAASWRCQAASRDSAACAVCAGYTHAVACAEQSAAACVRERMFAFRRRLAEQ